MSLAQQCAIQRGFFVLRDCGELALQSCHICSRPVCQEHARLEGTMLRCLECLARAQADVEETDAYNGTWLYYQRQSYAADAAETSPPTYDAADVQAFAQPGREELQSEDDSADSALES